MTYTASEMLNHAKRLELSAGALRREGKTSLAEFSESTAQMLRQAADAMEADDTLFAERIGP